jgi:hypothetical protein
MPGHLAHSSQNDDLANRIPHYLLGVNFNLFYSAVSKNRFFVRFFHPTEGEFKGVGTLCQQ